MGILVNKDKLPRRSGEGNADPNLDPYPNVSPNPNPNVDPNPNSVPDITQTKT